MQPFCRSLRVLESHVTASNLSVAGRHTASNFLQQPIDYSKRHLFPLLTKCISCSSVTPRTKFGFQTESSTYHNNDVSSASLFYRSSRPGLSKWDMFKPTSPTRCITTMGHSEESVSQDGSYSTPDLVPRIKFKRPDKTAKHIMQILDKEAVEEVREKREICDIKPGYIVQLKVEVPENKRRVSILKGIVIARRNAGLNTTFRIRRLVAGVGVESVFPLYSPNIKEMKVLDKKKVRRAKLYYLRDKMNALKKH